MRICILTQADSFAWTQHYVDAFRQRGEVLTVGPGLSDADRANWGFGNAALQPVSNDIEVTLTPDLDLRTVWPAGWEPDLVVGISKGGIALRVLPDAITCPSVLLSIDTWQSPGDFVDAQQYDFVFAAQREAVERLRAAGASNVEWLPLAANPNAHFPVDIETDLDIAFVGRIVLPVHRIRHELLNRLEESVSSFLFTQAYGDEVCEVVSRGRLAFNHAAVRDVNMRIFELMAMRRPVLTNRDSEHNGLLELFEDGKHLIVYDGADDVVEKARYYLDHDDQREAIAQAGFELVMAQHTYLHRVDTILEAVRKRVPLFASRTMESSEITGHALADLVPHGAKKVVDFGTTAGIHAEQLRARGVEELTGVSGTATQNGHYDAVVPLTDPEQWPREQDALLLSDTTLLHNQTKGAIRRARNLLVPGGSLIVQLTAHDFSAGFGIATFNQLNSALCECGLHLNIGRVEETGGGANIIVRARKRTRVAAALIAMVRRFTRLLICAWPSVFGKTCQCAPRRCADLVHSPTSLLLRPSWTKQRTLAALILSSFAWIIWRMTGPGL